MNIISCLNAFSVAFTRLILEVVLPFVLLQTSLIPASARIFATSFSQTRPFPYGAGKRVISTDPHFPDTAKGIE